MNDAIPAGARADRNAPFGPQPGDVWNNFEWVSPERYEELRATTMPHLPPMQPTREELRDAAIEYGELGAEIEALTAGGPPPKNLHEESALADAERTGTGFLVDGRHIAPERVAIFLPNQRRPRPEERARILPMPTLVRQMLVHLDPDFHRGGLTETPERVAKAWAEWTAGYHMDPAKVLKAFEDGAQGCDEMVVVQNIPVYSKCEHHLADIFGTADIAYIPDGRIVGLSKLPRLVEVFARRLQVQERMTNQIADALMNHLKPRGCGVVIRARHMCMESRGIRQVGQHTTTSALRGVFAQDLACRSEFLSLTRG